MTGSIREAVPHILIVDDDPNIHQLFRHLLRPDRYRLSHAEGAGEAFARLQSDAFDLVLLDIGLSDMNGLDLLSRLKKAEFTTRVIIITAGSTPEDVIRAMQEQAYDFVRKPFAPREIERAIDRALHAEADPDFEVISAKPDWLELSIPCTLAAAERIESYVRQLTAGHDLELSQHVGEVFRELVMNAVEWGGKLDPTRRTRIACIRTQTMLLYRIADPGPGFIIEEISHASFANPDPVAYIETREAMGLRPGGLGIVMATAMADEVLYNQARNEVLFIKLLPRSGAADLASGRDA